VKSRLFFISALLLILFFFVSLKNVNANYATSDWITTQNLSHKIAGHVSVSVDDSLYVMGGANSDDYASILNSTPSITGPLSAWSSLSSLPSTGYWFSLSQMANGNVYILGGAKFSGSQSITNKVYFGKEDSNGEWDWQEVNPLPGNRAQGASVIVNNRIYFAGGLSGSTRHNDIFYADINPDGTLGDWITSTITLPIDIVGFGMIEDNGNIYVIGGSTSASQSNVYKTSVNDDGSISAWQTLESLPQGVYRGAVIKVGDRILSIGGQTGGVVLDKVFYADINSDSSLSQWQESASSLPISTTGASVAQIGDYLYIAGGWNSGGYLDDVFYAKIDDSVDLSVPLLKQTSSPWNDDLYDSANLWASDSSFSRWGCAVTSAAMVFNYYGLDEMVGGAVLDPGSLNEWLKSQPDGYIGNGNTNWLALSRLSEQISDQNVVDFDALEFSREVSSNQQIVKDGIDNDIPSILRVPGHFVVGKGYADEDILINDPYYERADLAAYGNTFQNISKFTPSNTDLSYIMLTVDDGVDIKVFDESSDEVGSLLIEEPIEDPSGEASSSAKSLKVVYIAKPTSGVYRVEISSDAQNDYDFDAYLYDTQGEVKKFSFGETADSDPDVYVIEFNKQNFEESNVEKELVVTYDSLISDIEKLYKDKKLKLGGRISLSVKTKLAKAFSGNNKMELRMLKNLKKEVEGLSRKRQISNDTKSYLLERIEVLIKNI